VHCCLVQQGDDKTLIVWRTEDWTPIARVTEPFQRWLTLAFSLRCVIIVALCFAQPSAQACDAADVHACQAAGWRGNTAAGQLAKVNLPHSCRLCWAPDGSAVVGVNSFQSPKHTAVILQRGTWGQGDRVPDYLVSAGCNAYVRQ
jgi:protein HIRA/HIR1